MYCGSTRKLAGMPRSPSVMSWRVAHSTEYTKSKLTKTTSRHTTLLMFSFTNAYCT